MSSRLRLPVAGIALAIVACLSAVPAVAVTFTDGVFSDANWSEYIVAEHGPPAAVSGQQVAAGGNPDEFRSVQHFYGGLGDITSGHLNSAAVYDPSTAGAIATVQFAFDLNLLNGGDSFAVAFGALLTQGASTYVSGQVLTTTNTWTHHDLGVVSAASFSKAAGPGPSQPDFSDTGGPIQFGYYAANGTGIARPTSTDSGVDNWFVGITAAAPAPVPEPGTLALLSGGVAGLACLRRLRRKQ